MALSVPGEVLQCLPNPAEELRVPEPLLRPAPLEPPSGTPGDVSSVVDRRAGELPHVTHARQTVGVSGGGRDGLAHRIDLRDRGGTPSSVRSIFPYRSSISMMSSPTFFFSRVYKETVPLSNMTLLSALRIGRSPTSGASLTIALS